MLLCTILVINEVLLFNIIQMKKNIKKYRIKMDHTIIINKSNYNSFPIVTQ